MLLLPLVVQEWCQAVLWRHIAVTPGTTCDPVNRAMSSVVTYVICLVPAWFSSTPILVGAPDAKKNWESYRWTILAGMVFGILGIAIERGSALAEWTTTRCTYAGPWHHQVWPVMHLQFQAVWPNGTFNVVGWALAFMNLGVYGCASAGIILLPQPSVVVALLCTAFMVAAVLVIFLGPEWGSFWCFQASLVVLAAVFEPWILKLLSVYMPTFGHSNSMPNSGNSGSDRAKSRKSSTDEEVELEMFLDAEDTEEE